MNIELDEAEDALPFWEPDSISRPRYISSRPSDTHEENHNSCESQASGKYKLLSRVHGRSLVKSKFLPSPIRTLSYCLMSGCG